MVTRFGKNECRSYYAAPPPVPRILPPRTYAAAAATEVASQRIARAASQFLESEVIHPNLRGARALIAITSK